MSARSKAQQERRARERAASESMQAASSVPEDMQVEFQPDPELSGAPEPAEDSPRRDDDVPPLREFKRGNADRDSAMEELIASRQERERELTESETPEPNAEAPQILAPEPPKTVRVKIDGEESDVLAEEVEALGGKNAYQIIKAQEKRLASINEMLREAKQIRSAQNIPPPPPPRRPEELIREAVAKIQVSTPEEGAEALAGVLQSYMPKAVDTQAVTYQAMQLMRATDAEDRFVRDNADLIQNPLLKNLIISEKQRRLGEYQQKQVLPSDWNSFYTEIANDVRTAIGRPAPKPAQSVQSPSQNTSGSAEKEARKASITALPTASQRAPLQEEQKPPTRADLLNEMRKARGQPV